MKTFLFPTLLLALGIVASAAQVLPRVEALKEILKELKPGTPQEYEKIPAIWELAIAAGKENQEKELLGFLEISLPTEKEPLRDWQAVVLGGGLINGISQKGAIPADRIEELLSKRPEWKKTKERLLLLSAKMADDPRIPEGTRYDALRILGIGAWEPEGAILERYLDPKQSGELRMGAWSGLSDQNTTPAARALLRSMEAGNLKPSQLGKIGIDRLKNHPDPSIRDRTLKLLEQTEFEQRN